MRRKTMVIEMTLIDVMMMVIIDSFIRLNVKLF